MRRFINLAAIGAALTVCGVASAQETRDYTPVNFAFRLGVALPIDDNLSSLGDTLFAVGVDYRIDRPFFPNGETFFSIDWFGKSTSGAKGNVFPVNVNHKWFTSGTGLPTTDETRAYFFAGVGAVIIDVGTSDTVLGARAGIGVELGTYFFAEGAFYISDKGAGNVRSTAAALYLGYRF